MTIKPKHSYRRIEVYCSTKKEWFDEGHPKLKFLNIEEDMYGRDKMTFICPLCKKKHTSLRVG